MVPAATLAILVRANTTQANAALARTQGLLKETSRAADLATGRMSSSFTRAGTRMQAAGRSLTRGVSVPLAAIGTAAVATSLEYHKSMLLIQTQSGASAKEMKNMTQEVLNFAKSGKTIFGPTDLSRALFRIEGMGLRGAKAMDALRQSAKLAAVGGLDDVEMTAKTLGQVWFTNIKGAGSFNKIVAELNATVGQGDLRLTQLVDALGTGVIAAMKQAGLSFHDTTAALAVFGDMTNNVSGWSAQLATALHFLYDPSTVAQKSMKAIGLSQQQLVKDMAGPQGLITVLTDLKTHLETLPGGLHGPEALQVLGDILPGGKGRVLLVLMNQLDRLKMKTERISASTDKFGTAVDKSMALPANRLQAALAQLQASLIDIGDKIVPAVIPILIKFGNAIAFVFSGFSKLPDVAQDVALGLIALGPTVNIIGGVVTGIGRLIDVFKGLAVAETEAAAASQLTLFPTGAAAKGAGVLTGMKTMAGRIGMGLRRFLPGALAAVGIGNILMSVLKGDKRGAIFKAGGSIAGALVGGLVGGLPGALAGAGIGSILGGFLGKIAKTTDTHISLRDQIKSLREQGKKLADAQRQAVAGYVASGKDLHRARDREAKSAHAVHEAERHLQNVLEHHPASSNMARHAAIRYQEALDNQTQAENRARRAEQVHGHEAKLLRETYRRRLDNIRETIGGLRQQKKNEQDAADTAFRHWNKTGKGFHEAAQKQAELDKTSKQLRNSQHDVTKILAQAQQLLGGKVANSLDNATKKQGKMRSSVDQLDRAIKNQATDLRQKYIDSADIATRQTKKFQDRLDQFNGIIDNSRKVARQAIQNGFNPFGKGLENTRGDVNRFGSTVHELATGGFPKLIHSADATRQKVTGDTKGMRQRGGQDVGNFTNAIAKGVNFVNTTIQKVAKNLGVSVKSFAVQKPKTQQKQQGGALAAAQQGMMLPPIGGSGSGDKVLFQAMVEPGEVPFILNRNASSALLGLQQLNSNIPRFQTGGLQPGIAKLARTMIDQFGGYISSGLRPGDTGSYHSQGLAADWVGGDWLGGTRYANQVGPQLLEGIHNPVPHPVSVSWDSGHQVSPAFWGGATWADHADHVHLATGQMINAAAQGAGVRTIGDLFLRGPKGSLTTTGQRGLNLTVAAANAWIKKHAPRVGVEGVKVPPGSLSQMEIQRLWTRVNAGQGDAHLMSAIAMAESGGNPAVTNSIGARGLYQIIPSTAAGYHLNYGRLTEAAYNTFGAGKVLAGQGLGAWSAYTNGSYSQYMARGGRLRPIPRLQGGGDGKDGDGLVSTLPGWYQTALKKGWVSWKPTQKAIGNYMGQWGVRGLEDPKGGPISLLGVLGTVQKKSAQKLPFQDALARVKGQIQKQGITPQLANNVQRYRNFADQAADAAAFAGGLNETKTVNLMANPKPPPTLIPTTSTTAEVVASYDVTTPGTVRQKDELQWTAEQLRYLNHLRNRLLQAERVLKHKLAYVEKLIALARRIANKITGILHRIGNLRGRLNSRVKDLQGRIEDLQKKAKNASGDAKAALQGQIEGLQAKLAGARLDLYRLDTFAAPGTRRMRDALENTIKPALTDRAQKLKQQVSDRRQDLAQVQGAGKNPRGPVDKITWAVNQGTGEVHFTPALGAFLGDIGDSELGIRTILKSRWQEAQDKAAALATKPESIGGGDTGTDSELAALLQQQLEAAQRELAVLRAQQPVLSAFAGLFAHGGRIRPGMWGIVGERGPEIVSGPNTVTPTASTAVAPVNVHLQVDNGMEWLVPFIHATVEGREAKIIAQAGRSSRGPDRHRLRRGG